MSTYLLQGKIVDSAGAVISVDTAIQKNSPDLCLTLYRLLTGLFLFLEAVEIT
jgi:hypothetical protein